MSAVVVPFAAAARATSPQTWRADELSEVYRVIDLLARTGIAVSLESGVSDEGDPWLAVMRDDTDDVVVHIARIDGMVVVASAATQRTFTGRNLGEVMRSVLRTQPLILPGDDTQLFLHPIALLAAFIATALAQNPGLTGRAENAVFVGSKEAAAGQLPTTEQTRANAIVEARAEPAVHYHPTKLAGAVAAVAAAIALTSEGSRFWAYLDVLGVKDADDEQPSESAQNAAGELVAADAQAAPTEFSESYVLVADAAPSHGEPQADRDGVPAARQTPAEPAMPRILFDLASSSEPDEPTHAASFEHHELPPWTTQPDIIANIPPPEAQVAFTRAPVASAEAQRQDRASGETSAEVVLTAQQAPEGLHTPLHSDESNSLVKFVGGQELYWNGAYILGILNQGRDREDTRDAASVTQVSAAQAGLPTEATATSGSDTTDKPDAPSDLIVLSVSYDTPVEAKLKILTEFVQGVDAEFSVNVTQTIAVRGFMANQPFISGVDRVVVFEGDGASVDAFMLMPGVSMLRSDKISDDILQIAPQQQLEFQLIDGTSLKLIGVIDI